MTSSSFDPEEVARFENETWSRCAGSYVDGFGALVGEAIGPLLDELGVQGGERVLDLGAGPGMVTAAAAGRGAAAVGIDFSPSMVEEARARHPGLEFQQASADALPFPDASFDVVTSNFMLHHVGRPEQVLAEAARVLRPGGRAGFTVWGAMEKLAAFGVFFAAVERHLPAAELPHGPLFGVSEPDVFHDLVRGAGFARSSVRELPTAWKTATLDPYLASFRDWADLGGLPAETRAAFEATVREGAAVFRSAHGYAMPNPALLITGVK